mgnify:CR=1 FL=1
MAATLALLTISTGVLADHHKSPQYKKTVLKSNFMKFPANAIAIGMVGAYKGKIIGACGMFNMIKVMDPDTGEIPTLEKLRKSRQEIGAPGGMRLVREGKKLVLALDAAIRNARAQPVETRSRAGKPAPAGGSPWHAS